MIHHQQGNQPGDLRPLLRPVTLGGLELPNRVVMAPATRCRADPATLTVTGRHAAYYAQRASAGLIVAEGTWVSEQAAGRYPDVPGIYSPAQVAAWRQVTSVVHAVGGRIVLQLWHTGAGFGPGPVPAALTAADLRAVVRDFGTAAGRARQAGFDGVEIAANGTYLLAQSLHPRLNRRRDGYGADRGRLLREVTDAVAAVATGLNRYPDRDAVALRQDLASYLGHGLTVADVRLLPAGAIPRTTSGKLARWACKARATSS